MTTNLRPGQPLPSHPPSPELFTQSDSYHASFLITPDEALEGALTRQRQAGMPDIGVSASQGKFLYLLAKTMNARRILEAGTLGG
jgi:predicted O-methyltransferase YrrM